MRNGTGEKVNPPHLQLEILAETKLRNVLKLSARAQQYWAEF